MADRQRQSEPEDQADETAIERDSRSTPGMPHWVKVFVIVGLALALLFVVAMVAGVGGDHGPGRHGPGRHGFGGDTPSSLVHRP